EKLPANIQALRIRFEPWSEQLFLRSATWLRSRAVSRGYLHSVSRCERERSEQTDCQPTGARFDRYRQSHYWEIVCRREEWPRQRRRHFPVDCGLLRTA